MAHQQQRNEYTVIMADGKRQNMAGRTATPKVNPSKDINDGDTVFYKAVGKR